MPTAPNPVSNLKNRNVRTVKAATPSTRPKAAPMAGTASILSNAHNTKIKGSSFVINTTNFNGSSKAALEVLYQRVAPNAILNEGGRADNAKCQPGTRKDVIRLIEKWMNDIEGDRILWLSGPAGGGKTAIMKTIAERSMKQRIRTINFFFFRGDTTRNNAYPIVPTLLYQLFLRYKSALNVIAKVFSTQARILDGTISQQQTLLSLISPTIRQSIPAGARIVMLVDGLDECDVNSGTSQLEILRALHELVMKDDSPFRLLIASRPEAHIQMAFNQLPSHVRTIFLDEQYSPERDILQFVKAEFKKIKKSHPSAHSLPHDWPSDSDIEGIVAKSSGQFIYAATVMRYLAHASTVPSLSLKRVQGIVPVANNSPFVNLDSIYIFILSHVDDPEATSSMLFMTFVKKGFIIGPPLKELLLHFNSRYNQALIESCASELSSIVKLTKSGNLEFYHASLPDFLVDKARSTTFWVDIDSFTTRLLVTIWEKRKIGSGLPYDSENLQAFLLARLTKATPEITHLLLYLPFPRWAIDMEANQTRFLRAIYTLYYKDDIITYKAILRRFIGTIFSNNVHSEVIDVPYAKGYLICYRRWNWLFKILESIRRKK